MLTLRIERGSQRPHIAEIVKTVNNEGHNMLNKSDLRSQHLTSKSNTCIFNRYTSGKRSQTVFFFVDERSQTIYENIKIDF